MPDIPESIRLGLAVRQATDHEAAGFVGEGLWERSICETFVSSKPGAQSEAASLRVLLLDASLPPGELVVGGVRPCGLEVRFEWTVEKSPKDLVCNFHVHRHGRR